LLSASERVRQYRDKSRDLRNSAQLMISEESRQDLESLANRYDLLASSVEDFEEYEQTRRLDF